MSDISDEEDGFDTGSPGGRGTGKKRANHNELERKRRQHQKDQLNGLRDAIPLLKAEKPSTVLILGKAKEYIDQLTKRAVDNEKEINKLLELTGSKARLPDKVMAMALQAFSPGISIKNEDLDALKQENAELKAKLESLQRLAAVGAQFGSVSSSASIKKEHVTPRRERTSFSMQSPPPLTAPSPQPQQGSPLVMHSSPNVNDASSPSSNKMAYLAQIVNQEVDALTGSNGDDLSDGGGFDHSNHYKKRKSYADNDFEAAKQDYFSSRRNSSFDILQQTQEHQQRLQVTEAGLSEASLLQNFVRRASLPSAFFDGAPPPALMQNSAHSDGTDDEKSGASDMETNNM